MPCLSRSEAKLNRLLIACPLETRNLFPSLDDDLFEVFASKRYFSLLVSPEKYVPSWERDSDKGKYRDTLTGQFAPISLSRYSFSVQADLPQAEILDLLIKLATDSTSRDLKTHHPIQVIDFVRPFSAVNSPKDSFISAGRPYTIRIGRITDLPEKSGSVGQNRLYNKGFTLQFQERDKRRYLG